MIKVEIPGSPPRFDGSPDYVVLTDGDNLLVTPEEEWASVRCNGPFVVVTPATLDEFRRLRTLDDTFVDRSEVTFVERPSSDRDR